MVIDGDGYVPDPISSTSQYENGNPGRYAMTGRREDALRVSSRDEPLSELLEFAPDAMVVVDDTGLIVEVNEGALALFGYERGELIGAPIEILVPARLHDRHTGHLSGYWRDPHRRAIGMSGNLFGRRRDGSEFAVEIALNPMDLRGRRYVMSAIRDITVRLAAEHDAFHFAAVVESSHDAIIGMDLDGAILSWNSGAERLYGYSAVEAVGRSLILVVPPGQEDEVRILLAAVRAGERADDLETVQLRRDGTQVDVSMTVSPILDREGNVVGASTIARDITAQIRYQRQLRFLADHDALTGVRNRRRFERDVSEQVDRAHHHGERAALLIIDVDNFKQINDSYGHRTGDRTLKRIANTLAARVRNSDMLARIGGDEFAVLLPYADGHQAQVVADSLSRTVSDLAVETPEGGRIRLTISIGIALIDELTASDESVLAEADRTMYRRKAIRHEHSRD